MLPSSSGILNGVKAIIISVIFTLVSILIFALLLKVFSLPNGIVKPINYLIKCASVFIGCHFSVKGEKGAIKGLVFGFLIMLVCHLLFSMLACNFAFTLNFVWDILLGGAVGVISGIIAVNKK